MRDLDARLRRLERFTPAPAGTAQGDVLRAFLFADDAGEALRALPASPMRDFLLADGGTPDA